MKTRILAAIIVAIMTLLSVCSALPVLALSESDVGYNAEDVSLLRALFETEDAEGVKIGERLNPGVYDPDDIETWTFVDDSMEKTFGVIWIVIGYEMRAKELCLDGIGIVGAVSLPICAELSLISCRNNEISEISASGLPKLNYIYCSGNEIVLMEIADCPTLKTVDCSSNMLASIDIENCAALELLRCDENMLTELDLGAYPALKGCYCANNELTSIDLTGCEMLNLLWCSGNRLTELDASACPMLDLLKCDGNEFTELDFSENDGMHFNTIRSEGSGYISCGYEWSWDPELLISDKIEISYAEPVDGAEFLGWYTPNGEFITANCEIDQNETSATEIVARFSDNSQIPGDADGDGAVSANDALIILRAALGLEGDPAAMVYYCDMDGNGVVNAADALIILRIALGIE